MEGLCPVRMALLLLVHAYMLATVLDHAARALLCAAAKAGSYMLICMARRIGTGARLYLLLHCIALQDFLVPAFLDVCWTLPTWHNMCPAGAGGGGGYTCRQD